jgi:hypothetical protein
MLKIIQADTEIYKAETEVQEGNTEIYAELY